ncbi:protein-tyrosine phosphatase-like protein [Ochromonadaceae sp. CCMP2298]|nr:protein-tyrosine phosphatase-like protein [Ochromonadaceae sp. CCMP2298]
MTNYRLVFIPSAADLSHIALQNPAIHSLLQVPLAAIERIDRDRRSKDFSGPVNLVISCKDFRILRVAIRSAGHGGTGDHDVERAISVMAAYCFPNNMRFLFAFSHKFAQLGVEYAPEPYDAALEFSRMGVLDNPYWRVTGANASYKLCNTYPQWLVVPSLITDEELHVVSAFRSGHRLPVMCWCNKQGISMWRSSQPKAGVSGTCTQDERMLDAIARSMHQSHTPSTGTYRKRSSSIVEPVLYIVDCRSRTSAMANRAAGAGYESQTNYPHTRLDFYSISNIHGVRDSYKAMAALLLSPQASVSSDLTFLKMAEDTQWLTYTRTILKASLDTANLLNGGFPVLVHCSHGWDRTAQVCSLAQLFLDPYYRTFEGFRVLIEKEWVALGHPFQMRSAHAQDKSSRAEDQMSPVMIQFLDCVWQILHQFQHYFEFNSRYLLSIADHVYSGRFGTFLFSCDYDRDLYNTRHLCADLWTYLNQNRGIFANPFYQEGHGVLLPPLSLMLRNVTLWKDYFFRWSAAPSLMPTPIQLSQLLHFDGM